MATKVAGAAVSPAPCLFALTHSFPLFPDLRPFPLCSVRTQEGGAGGGAGEAGGGEAGRKGGGAEANGGRNGGELHVRCVKKVSIACHVLAWQG